MCHHDAPRAKAKHPHVNLYVILKGRGEYTPKGALEWIRSLKRLGLSFEQVDKLRDENCLMVNPWEWSLKGRFPPSLLAGVRNSPFVEIVRELTPRSNEISRKASKRKKHGKKSRRKGPRAPAGYWHIKRDNYFRSIRSQKQSQGSPGDASANGYENKLSKPNYQDKQRPGYECQLTLRPKATGQNFRSRLYIRLRDFQVSKGKHSLERLAERNGLTITEVGESPLEWNLSGEMSDTVINSVRIHPLVATVRELPIGLPGRGTIIRGQGQTKKPGSHSHARHR